MEAIEADHKAKERQRKHKDDKRYVKHHQLTVGNQVLLKQKSYKHVPPYNPRPYTVTGIHGHQITARREDEEKTRDAQKWKKVNTRPPTDYNQVRQKAEEERLQRHYNEDDFIDIGTTTTLFTPPSSTIQDTNTNIGEQIDIHSPATGQAVDVSPTRELTPANRPIRNRRKPVRFADSQM